MGDEDVFEWCARMQLESRRGRPDCEALRARLVQEARWAALRRSMMAHCDGCAVGDAAEAKGFADFAATAWRLCDPAQMGATHERVIECMRGPQEQQSLEVAVFKEGRGR